MAAPGLALPEGHPRVQPVARPSQNMPPKYAPVAAFMLQNRAVARIRCSRCISPTDAHPVITQRDHGIIRVSAVGRICKTSYSDGGRSGRIALYSMKNLYPGT